jgi:hypothetical protein
VMVLASPLSVLCGRAGSQSAGMGTFPPCLPSGRCRWPELAVPSPAAAVSCEPFFHSEFP